MLSVLFRKCIHPDVTCGFCKVLVWVRRFSQQLSFRNLRGVMADQPVYGSGTAGRLRRVHKRLTGAEHVIDRFESEHAPPPRWPVCVLARLQPLIAVLHLLVLAALRKATQGFLETCIISLPFWESQLRNLQ